MAFREAWPALVEVDLGGWVARHSGDAIRRTSSLNPLPGGGRLDAAMLKAGQWFYTQHGKPALIRYPDFLVDHTALFRRLGYQPEGQTLTLLAPDIASPSHSLPSIAVRTLLDSDWLTARPRIIAGDQQVFQTMLDRIRCPALFASVTIDATVAAVAYGVVVDRLLIVESVATDQAFQGRGLARAMVGAIMARARALGAESAALQVVEGNEPALALYQRLGFSQLLYRYCYYRERNAR